MRILPFYIICTCMIWLINLQHLQAQNTTPFLSGDSLKHSINNNTKILKDSLLTTDKNARLIVENERTMLNSKGQFNAKKDSNLLPIDLKNTVTADTNYFAFITKYPVPKRAAMYSAILPGLGQAYNGQYWKIPIVYAGVAVSSYLLYNTYTDYQLYRKAFIIRTDNNPNTVDDLLQYDVNSLRDLERSNRARLDRIVVYSAVYYGLNLIDALVSAHLKNFDMGKSISLQIQPTFIQNNTAGIGIKTILKF
jgi:Family of unknown function (DUF5683)